MPAPIESVDDQDTDPSDIASLAMSELSDGAQSSIASPTIGIGDPGQDTGSFISSTGKPAPPQPSSISGQYQAAGHLPDEAVTVTVQTLFIASAACAAAGILVGVLIGLLF